VPDFEAGAMENAGAVFFRETLLLLDPATRVHPGAQARGGGHRARAGTHVVRRPGHHGVVGRPLAERGVRHLMAYGSSTTGGRNGACGHGFEHDRSGALAQDALRSTHPIYAPVRSVAEATENFDAITYEKGAAVVRMIEHYLGPDQFRDGVRVYMRRHREGNAVAADLWRALEEASGREVTRVAQAWIAQAGFPLVTVAPAPDGHGLRVRQERFFADPRVPPARRRERWPVPLVVKWADGGGPEHRAASGRPRVAGR
jgi:puromycin-sensitive aminopeptidase